MGLLDNPKAAPLLGLVAAGLVGYLFYTGDGISSLGFEGIPAKKERAKAVADSITRIEAYRGTLAVLRQLVPERNEVPNLLNDISTRAKIRGVNLSEVVPQPVSAGPAPFDTYAYKLSVVGRFDQI